MVEGEGRVVDDGPPMGADMFTGEMREPPEPMDYEDEQSDPHSDALRDETDSDDSEEPPF